MDPPVVAFRAERLFFPFANCVNVRILIDPRAKSEREGPAACWQCREVDVDPGIS